jgi:hypothetical protein
MGNLFCMGLILRFRAFPTPRRLDHPHHRLPAGMDVDMLHRDLLLALAAVAVERFEQRGEAAGELIGLGEVLAPALASSERLGEAHSFGQISRRVPYSPRRRRRASEAATALFESSPSGLVDRSFTARGGR